MNKTMWIVLVILVIVFGVYYVVKTDNPSLSSIQPSTARGDVVFSVTDAAVDMGTISEINMKVSGVDAHSTDGSWVTVATTPHTYNLLALNTKHESDLLANASLKTGIYDQVRLTVDSISVVTKAGVTKDAKLPSSELKIDTTVVVNEGETSSVNLDFLASKSLHTTGTGAYIFTPVVKTETRSNASVAVNAQNVVNITGGTVDDSNTVGMDIDGSVKANFQINADAKLNLDSNNKIINLNTNASAAAGLLK